MIDSKFGILSFSLIIVHFQELVAFGLQVVAVEVSAKQNFVRSNEVIIDLLKGLLSQIVELQKLVFIDSLKVILISMSQIERNEQLFQVFIEKVIIFIGQIVQLRKFSSIHALKAILKLKVDLKNCAAFWVRKKIIHMNQEVERNIFVQSLLQLQTYFDGIVFSTRPLGHPVCFHSFVH